VGKTGGKIRPAKAVEKGSSKEVLRTAEFNVTPSLTLNFDDACSYLLTPLSLPTCRFGRGSSLDLLRAYGQRTSTEKRGGKPDPSGYHGIHNSS
jgi:hypothetical protein